MHTSKFMLILGLFIVSSCASTSDTPALPKDAQKVSFTHTQETFRRGLKAMYPSTATSRPSAIIEAIYSIECLSGGTPSAQVKFSQAQDILKKAYVEAPVFYDNPRERGSWRSKATEKIFDKTSCVVKGLEYGKVNTDKTQVLLWALKNGVDLE